MSINGMQLAALPEARHSKSLRHPFESSVGSNVPCPEAASTAATNRISLRCASTGRKIALNRPAIWRMSVEQLAIREETMRRVILRGWALALGVVGALALAGPAAAQEKKVIIGVQCDRDGPTQIVGTVICPAFQDYFNYINSQGGIEGYKIEAPEIDNGYKVATAVEASERQKQQGAVMMSAYGTPQTQALNERRQADRAPATSPGFGISASA